MISLLNRKNKNYLEKFKILTPESTFQVDAQKVLP